MFSDYGLQFTLHACEMQSDMTRSEHKINY